MHVLAPMLLAKSHALSNRLLWSYISKAAKCKIIFIIRVYDPCRVQKEKLCTR